jgi:hypothetical protein
VIDVYDEMVLPFFDILIEEKMMKYVKTWIHMKWLSFLCLKKHTFDVCKSLFGISYCIVGPCRDMHGEVVLLWN